MTQWRKEAPKLKQQVGEVPVKFSRWPKIELYTGTTVPY